MPQTVSTGRELAIRRFERAPEHWDVVRLRRVATSVTKRADGQDRQVALEDIESWTGRFAPSGSTYGAEGIAFRRGDVLFGKLRPYLAKVYEADRDGQAIGDFLVIRPGERLSSRFLKYVLLAPSLIESVAAGTYGAKMPRTNWEDLGSHSTALPPLDEQRRIAAFLDRETSRIDELMALAATARETLLERRVALTHHAVSGTLIHSECEETGVPWLSGRALGWTDVQIRRVAKLGSGHTPSRSKSEYWTNCSVPWVTTGEVSQLRSDRVEYVCQTREKISELGMANSSAVLHPAGTVVLSRTASAGYSGIMGSPMATSQDFVTWTCGPKLRPRFLLLCLRAMREDLLGRLAVGSTHKTIYMPDVEELMIPLPPVDEQDRIVEEAWRHFRIIDEMIDALEQHVQLLRERRSALITAAVTGTIVVRFGNADASAEAVA